jgi:hypothetical protein
MCAPGDQGKSTDGQDGLAEFRRRSGVSWSMSICSACLSAAELRWLKSQRQSHTGLGRRFPDVLKFGHRRPGIRNEDALISHRIRLA